MVFRVGWQQFDPGFARGAEKCRAAVRTGKSGADQRRPLLVENRQARIIDVEEVFQGLVFPQLLNQVFIDVFLGIQNQSFLHVL